MRIDDLLTESPFFKKKASTRDEFAWHGDIKFEKRMQALKGFLEKYPVPSLLDIYKHALQAKSFEGSQLKRVQRFMMQHHWDEDSIALMSP
jgi:hypothetical protein